MVQFTMDAALTIQLILTVLMPILVGLITKKTTSSAIKAWLLAGTTLATSVLTGLYDATINSGVFDLGTALLVAIPAFAISVATHYGLWKPTGVSDAAQTAFSKDV